MKLKTYGESTCRAFDTIVTTAESIRLNASKCCSGKGPPILSRGLAALTQVFASFDSIGGITNRRAADGYLGSSIAGFTAG